MRFASIAALLVTVAAVSAAAARAAAPPVIHEPFTPRPCPAHAVTTVELTACAEQGVLKSDRAIDARARRIFGLLRSQAARASFVRGEQAWLRYRRASCSAESSGYAGGSGQPLVFATCERHRNATHLGDLADSERALRHR
jgi:uncharacterized protein YecT (DUF1311 family)